MSDDIRGRISRHEPIVGEQTSNPNYVALSIENLNELVRLAHDAVHPPKQEDDEPNVERGYDSISLRMQCLQLAQQMEINKIHALDEPKLTDPVMLAEAYFNFLKADSQ